MQKKRGISLIVLVITIIVMIILAATVIISLNNNKIVEKAQEAVDKTNKKQIEELANIAWANAYAGNIGKSDKELKPILKAAVEKTLTDNGFNPKDYGIYVTTEGVEIAKGWLQTRDRTVIKGDNILNIGDYIKYDATNGGAITGLKGTRWRVLGADKGELLILSEQIDDKYFNENKNSTEARNSYEKGVSELDALCAPYGKGAYALGARSITVEDIDRVTGYDKTTYGKGTISEYGNVITCSYNGTTKPAYSASNGASGTFINGHNGGLVWYNTENVYCQVMETDLKANSSGVITKDGIEAKIINENHCYNVEQETDLKTKAPNAYAMLFGLDGNNQYYWLASKYVDFNGEYIKYGLHYVLSGKVNGLGFVLSTGGLVSNKCGVRAVVTLSQDIKLTGSSTAGWSIT